VLVSSHFFLAPFILILTPTSLHPKASAVDLNTGDQTPLGSAAVASSDSALMTVALTNGFKVRTSFEFIFIAWR
jgi:hypothetical protein